MSNLLLPFSKWWKIWQLSWLISCLTFYGFGGIVIWWQDMICFGHSIHEDIFWHLSLPLCASALVCACADMYMHMYAVVICLASGFFSFLFSSLLFCVWGLYFVITSDAVDAENESGGLESKVAKETIALKELKRVDHILASLQRKVTSQYP